MKNALFIICKIFICFFVLLSPHFLFSKGIENATTYHMNSSVQKCIALKTINLISWKKEEKILDIGCGDGKITALISQKVPKGLVFGIDISKSMIEFASNHYPSDKYPNLTFLKQDVNEINFENHFDKVVSFSTLHWILDQEKALKAIYKALVPEGKICIHTYGQGKMNVTDVCEATINTKKWKPCFPNYIKGRVFLTKQDFHNLLKQAGFKKISIIESYSETSLSGKQALFDFVKPLLNSTQHLSQKQQQEFTEEVVERIIDIASSSQEGAIRYQTLNLQAIGIK